MIGTLLSSLSIVTLSPEPSEKETRQPKFTSGNSTVHMRRSRYSINRYACNHFREKSRFPSRSIKYGYLDSVAKEANVSRMQLVVAMIYTDRIQQMDSAFLETISSSDLFLISVLVAGKFLYDEGEEGALLNSEWARIGYRKQSTVNKLEKKYLQALDWDLCVNSNEFDSITTNISANLALQNGLETGSFSYGDLTTIWLWWERHHPSILLTWDLLSSILICCTVYAVGISTLLATTSLAHSSLSTSLPSQHAETATDSFNKTLLVESNTEPKYRINCSQWVANSTSSSVGSRDQSSGSIVSYFRRA